MSFASRPASRGAESSRDTGIGGEDFMQGAAYQPATGQVAIDFIYAERQHLTIGFGQGAAGPFKSPNMRLQPFQSCRSLPVSPFFRG